MKQETIQEAFDVVKTEEYQNFLKVMESLITEESGSITFAGNGCYCVTKKETCSKDCELKSGTVLSILKAKNGLSCQYKAYYTDPVNRTAWWEDVRNMQLVSIDKLTKHLGKLFLW